MLWITRAENVLRVLVLVASARRLGYTIPHTRKISFSGLVIQMTMYFISITFIIMIIHDMLFNCMNENVTIFHLFLLYLCDPVLVE
jgi:hypothetical protein